MSKEFITSSMFGDLVKKVKARMDAATKLNKELFGKAIYKRFLDWDTPTYGLNFEEIIGQYNLSVAAATIGDESKEIILGTQGLKTIQDKMLTHALTVPMTTAEYRKMMQLLDSKSITDATRNDEMTKSMWKQVTDAVDGVDAKLDIIFLQALMNKGVCTLDEINNPEGGVRANIDMGQPASNIGVSQTPWTAANSSTVDCFEDIQGILEAATDKVAFDRILLAPKLLYYMARTPMMKKLIFGVDKAARPVQLSDINEFMQANGYPVLEPLRRQCLIQNGGIVTPYNPVSQTNMVFIPSGKLGVIKNAFADSELKPETGVAYSNYGRIRVSQWGVGETQGSNGIEFTKATSTSLPVITEFQGIYTLDTQAE